MPVKDTRSTVRRISTQYTNYSDGTYQYNQGINLYNIGGLRTTANQVKGWKQRIRLGEDATTSLTAEESKIKFGKRDLRYRITNYGTDSNGNKAVTFITDVHDSDYVPSHIVLLGGNPNDLSESQAYAAALGKFNQRAHEVSTKFEGGAFLGELKETLHGITHPANALSHAFSSYFKVAKRLRKSVRKIALSTNDLGSKQVRNAIKSANRAIAGSWLEYTFGMQPLIHDIRDAMNAATAKYVQGRPFQFVSGTSTINSPYSYSESGSTLGPVSWTEITKISTEVSVTFRGAVNVSFNSPTLNDAELYGFNLSNFVPSVWEVVPYSWLVDYFTNIGDVISGISYGGMNVRWCAVTIRKQYITENWAVLNSISPDGPFTSFSGSLSGGLTRSWKKTVSRGTYHGNFIPLPTFELPMSPHRWANMIAVAGQLLDRLF